MATRKPHVGDWADHKSRSLDPRPVAEVNESGTMIRLSFLGTISRTWFDAANYTYKAPRS